MTPQPIRLDLESFKQIHLFQGFSDAELEAMAHVGELRQYEPLANIVIEGEQTGSLHLIVQGMVGIFKVNKLNGDTVDIGQLRQNQFFGEMSLIDDSPRAATVRALTDVITFELTKERFMQFLASSSDLKVRFLESCMKELMRRLRELDDNYIISQYQLWRTAVKKEAA